MQATESIWINGRLVQWADATVHVASHGLHYGSGVFEGIRAYETAGGSSIFRLTDHLRRLHDSARLLGLRLPYTVEELRAAAIELVAANGLAECYLRPIAFSGFGELGVSQRGNPVEVAIISWPWGAYLGEEGQAQRDPREDLVLAARRAERDPAHRQGDGHLPQLDARGQRGARRRLRRGDPAHERRVRRGRLGREHLRRARRDDLHARPVHLDPPGHHEGHDHDDRPEPRLRGRRAEPHPLRPLPRGRGVHVRHRRRGDAAPGDRQRRARRRPGDEGSCGTSTSAACVALPRTSPRGSSTSRSSSPPKLQPDGVPPGSFAPAVRLRGHRPAEARAAPRRRGRDRPRLRQPRPRRRRRWRSRS